jgi:hypothetical protein
VQVANGETDAENEVPVTAACATYCKTSYDDAACYDADQCPNGTDPATGMCAPPSTEGYSCENDGSCVEAAGGAFGTYSDCKADCNSAGIGGGSGIACSVSDASICATTPGATACVVSGGIAQCVPAATASTKSSGGFSCDGNGSCVPESAGGAWSTEEGCAASCTSAGTGNSGAATVVSGTCQEQGYPAGYIFDDSTGTCGPPSAVSSPEPSAPQNPCEADVDNSGGTNQYSEIFDQDCYDYCATNYTDPICAEAGGGAYCPYGANETGSCNDGSP